MCVSVTRCKNGKQIHDTKFYVRMKDDLTETYGKLQKSFGDEYLLRAQII